ncbi:MAG: site-2 protease family protein [Candidatus Nealsonbacteria bacterium]
MFLIILVAFFSLIALVVLHELGHFLLAKKFGVKVEEFGIGYPPRIFGKKLGETIYSLNLLPFGAFVKIYGHEERIQDSRSFSTKPIWQRALVILGGVISFWIVAAILLTIVMALGVPTMISDDESRDLVDPKVQIVAVVSDSPAGQAGLKIGDVVRKIQNQDISKVKELQEFIETNKGNEIIFGIQRGKEMIDISIVPREFYPEDQGATGIALVRTALESYPWYQAPIKGITATWNLTLMILDGWKMTFSSLFSGDGVPDGVEVRGIVGIFELFVQAGGLGISYFLQFIAIISVSLALINILPIPALDGGWFMLLMIEKFRGKPINQKTEQIISSFFFILLIGLMLWVTVKDIIRIF